MKRLYHLLCTICSFLIINISYAQYSGVKAPIYWVPKVLSVNPSSAQGTIIRLNMGKEAAAFDLYPNPFVGSLCIQLSNLPELARVVYHVSVQNEDINYQSKIQKL